MNHEEITLLLIIVFLFMAVLFLMIAGYILIKWQKMTFEIKQKEEQRKLDQMYSESFRHLIQDTRKRQHEFNNHINAIYGMHASIHNYEDLVNNQKEYCKKMEYENRFIRLLNSIGQPILAGFLYRKFILMEEKGIIIDYQVAVPTGMLLIDIHDFIEMIGILLDNASEALQKSEQNKKVKFMLICDQQILHLSVKNESKHYSHDEIHKFFQEGYSSKEKGSGLGLAKIRDFQKKYQFKILCEMCHLENTEWFSISILKE